MTEPTTTTPLSAPPDGMPDPELAPPQIARSGDPFARLRIVHLLSRLPRNTTLQLRDVLGWLEPGRFARRGRERQPRRDLLSPP